MGEDGSALKDMAAQLAYMLQVQGEKSAKGWDECIHKKLAEVAAAAAGDDPREAAEALQKLAKDASSSPALMRTLEETISKANPGLLKDLVLLVAHELNMTPLGNLEPVKIVDHDGNFCKETMDHIIHSSSELSAPNAPYAVISIVGGEASGKSYLLNRLFGTKFPVMNARIGRYRTTEEIMISRCIGPSLLLLDFPGLGFRRTKQDISREKQDTLFALTVSDLIMVNVLIFDIGRAQGDSMSLFTTIFQERAKLHLVVPTKILVILRLYDGEVPFEFVKSDVLEQMEMTWKRVNKELVKFTDYIEVNIVGLPDKNSSEFPKEVAVLRKLFPNNQCAKVPACGFSHSSSVLWDSIKKNKKLEIHQYQDYNPRKLIVSSKSSIISGPSSGHTEASRSTHSNNYISAAEPMAMTFRELQRMTDGFSENRLLGQGAFGMVYKGLFDNGEVIAVKKLHNIPGLVEYQFKNELLNLMTVQHQNIIRLVGYCSEAQQKVAEHDGKKVLFNEEQRALCLEYMEGGTLEKLISDESCGLDWEARYRIIEGTCQGLKHLHTGSKDAIYHLDLKPANILLDKDRIPKIGDFGLSRLLASTGTFVAQTMSGTPVYMPPEYTHGLEISSKFDVFSLGIIIIQVIAGRDGYYNYKCLYTSPQEFIYHVTGNWRKNKQANLMSTEALLEVENCIKMALRCVEVDRAKRPTITEVVDELNMIRNPHGAPFMAILKMKPPQQHYQYRGDK